MFFGYTNWKTYLISPLNFSTVSLCYTLKPLVVTLAWLFFLQFLIRWYYYEEENGVEVCDTCLSLTICLYLSIYGCAHMCMDKRWIGCDGRQVVQGKD